MIYAATSRFPPAQYPHYRVKGVSCTVCNSLQLSPTEMQLVGVWAVPAAKTIPTQSTIILIISDLQGLSINTKLRLLANGVLQAYWDFWGQGLFKEEAR